ncbi:MAG: polysaccharide deacetylase family protein [Candidatus Kryptoniota bacterium]
MQINIILNCTETVRAKAKYAFEVLFSPMRVSLFFSEKKREDSLNIAYQFDTPEDKTIFYLEESKTFSKHLDRKTIPDLTEIRWINFSGKRLPTFFKTNDELGFDIAASTFFLASNYQDLISPDRDSFDRLNSNASLQKVGGFLKIPVVNYYSLLLMDRLERFYQMKIKWRKYSGKDCAIALTHDVDYTSSLNPKIIKREVIGNGLLNKQQFGGRDRLFKIFLPVMALGGYNPPRNGLKFFKEIEEKYKVHSTFFFKTGTTEKWDVNYPVERGFINKFIQSLLRDGFEVGIHPSMKTYIDLNQMKKEMERLESTAKTRVGSVRQHYLKFAAGITPAIWREAGLKIDSTLGFPYDTGFRNSVAFPFPLYNFSVDSQSGVTEIPLVIMDGTLKVNRQKDIKLIYSEVESLLREITEARGSAAVLFHNSIKDPVEFRGFPEMYEWIIEFLLRENFFIGSLSEVVDSFR